MYQRKIAIIEFATKSRQQFVRLLALVKWAASAEDVVKCQVCMHVEINKNPSRFYFHKGLVASLNSGFNKILMAR